MASSFDHQWKACQREIKATSAASETTALNTTSEARSAVLISEALSAVFLAPLLSKGRVTSNTVFVPQYGPDPCLAAYPQYERFEGKLNCIAYLDV